MYKLIQQLIRFAAAMSFVQATSMALGWSTYSNSALLVDAVAIGIWAWSEYDMWKANKNNI
ncbi:hypothetical protein [Mangrovibacter phragmitis]|uniref:hypothetical protein n=1 Tax=Mangrovibacter phragmitis TaxID=1691903 RepID=UPI00351782A3